MCCSFIGGHYQFGISMGLVAFIVLLLAFFSGSWLTTTEPATLPNSLVSTNIEFRIGLWKACLLVERVNSTTHVPKPSCSPIKYEGWRDVTYSDFGLRMPLNLAPVFINRMRSCTILTGSAVVLLALASLLSFLGQFNNDSKSLIACGFFILGGLSLGTGLVIFATALSETLNEIMEEFDAVPGYDYRYGWCFFAGGTALILSNLAAMFSLSEFINHFESTDEMVRQMVPGMERKFEEHQLFTKYLSENMCIQTRLQYVIEKCRPQHDTSPRNYGTERENSLNKTPPDVCATNTCIGMDVGGLKPKMIDHKNSVSITLAGESIPITIRNNTANPPIGYASLPINKYETLPPSHSMIHRGFFGLSDVGYLSGYCSKNKTVRYQTTARKNCSKDESFQASDAGFSDIGKKVGLLQCSGSIK